MAALLKLQDLSEFLGSVIPTESKWGSKIQPFNKLPRHAGGLEKPCQRGQRQDVLFVLLPYFHASQSQIFLPALLPSSGAEPKSPKEAWG